MAITRRDFLAASLGTSTLVSLGGGVPGFLARTASGATANREARDTILVVVQLAGGNDGLNTVVPYGDDGYGRNRTTLRLPAATLHKIDTLLGFHPEMQAFNRLYKEGHLTIVQGVGYPNQSQDHPVAMRAWQTAQPGRLSEQSGWLGRAVDRAIRPGDPTVPAVFIGQIKQPFSLNAEQAVVPSLRGLEDWILQQPPAVPPKSAVHTTGDGLYDFVRCTSAAAQCASRQIESLVRAQSASTAAEYPSFQLAGKLRTIAQLIRADLGIRIFCTELGGEDPGGFDNHAGQRDNHASLLRQLSDSVAAFFDDLRRQKLLDRVVLMTFSEFGRTVEENGRRGTDHGVAAQMFLAGSKVRGGLVGPHPSLTDLDNGGMRFHTDFRRIYATLLDCWLGFESQPILGQQYEPLHDDLVARYGFS
ncbi:MAG: DUF1501 domain-containing protein [Thermoguttaceae bacterium]|jgi:uncharacterized protein (DUF1501 family)